MGNAIARRVSRPLKNFAVEARAEKVLSREKPEPAAWHPSTEKKIKEYIESNPTLLDEQVKKDDDLLNRLKNVYVTSEDVGPPKEETKGRHLPQNRSIVIESDFGYPIPETVPKGKITLHQALTFLAKHQESPSEYSAAAFAEKHYVEQRVAENVLKHFRTFQLITPPLKNAKQKTQNAPPQLAPLSVGIKKLLSPGKKE